jgi:hypothetical protein
MKNILLILLISSLPMFLYSQDKIVRTNGEIIPCKIDKEDSTTVYFTFYRNGKKISTLLDKENVASIERKTIPVTGPGYPPDLASFGLGIGIDYGGIGGSFLFYPQKNIGLFLSGGYAFVGFGYNVGIKLRYAEKMNTSKILPYLSFMYGYNAVIKVKNGEDLNKMFYGPSIALGIDAHFRRKSTGYWTFELIIPFRGTQVDDYTSELEKNHGVVFENKLPPLMISVGHRFTFN